MLLIAFRQRAVTTNIVLAVLLASMVPVVGQTKDPLELVVARYAVADSPVPDALLQLGFKTGIPLGIVATDPSLWKRKISLDISGETFSSLLSRILSAAPGYAWSVDHGVVVISSTSVTTTDDFINAKIRSFDVEKPQDAENLSADLWMAVLLTLDPGRREGFYGVLHPSSLDRELPPAHLSGSETWVILNWIVREHGKAAWIAMPFTGDIQKTQVNQLWKLFFYPQEEVTRAK